ncbi:MAG: HEAT repeat domain-containing protein [Deltaproteobacteria bacterium]|nr:HEAT repeat domain-containing protein [Deltaproteobacteria bacterium]
MRFHLCILIPILVLFVLLHSFFCFARQIPLPRAEEGEHPIDRALSAIAMKQTDLSLRPDLIDNPYALSAFDRWMKRPLKAPIEAQLSAMKLFRAMERPDLWLEELATLGDVYSLHTQALEKDTSLTLPSGLPEPMARAIHILLGAMGTANKRLGQIKAGISPENLVLLEKYLSPSSCSGEKPDQEALEPDRPDEYRKALEIAGKVDRKAMLEAGLILSRSLVEARKILESGDDWQKDIRSFHFMSPVGRVEIGGMGDDRHENGAALIIELGGNDLYRGKVASGTHGKCALALDLAGDDSYLGENLTQGAGLWGVGILFDLEGNDLYRAMNCSQGAGHFGLGLLVDGAGKDVFLGGSFVQAAASWGWGGLLELAGDDLYQCRRNGQAHSQVLGVSSLCDRKGNDRYLSGVDTPDPREADMNQSLSQGFAIGRRNLAAGGLALLADQGGNDHYQCQYFGQGASYWMGVGILYDERGKDTYVARRYAQGAGIHFSFGLFMDALGNDHTSSWGVSQGCGHDYGVGLFVNEAGDDTYVSQWLSLGASNANGIGLFVDNTGNDGYETASGMAVGKYHPGRRAGGIGLFVDAGGKDRYSLKGGDNSLWIENRWAVGIDENAHGVSGLNILRPEEKPPLEDEKVERRIAEQKQLTALLEKAESMPYPADIEGILTVASHWGFEKDIPRTAKEKLLAMDPRKTVPALVNLLDTPSTMALIFFNRFFAVHAYHALPALIKKTEDVDPLIRTRALYFLGRLKDSRALAACTGAREDPSWRVRATAVRALGDMLDKRRLQFLLPMKQALERALDTSDPGPIKDFLNGPQNGRKAISVLVRAVPLDYKTYRELSEGFAQDSAMEFDEEALLLFKHMDKIRPVLQRWIEDIHGSGKLAEKLMDYLKGQDPEVRRSSAYALGQMGYGPAIPMLLMLLNDPELWVRDGAAKSMVLFGEEAIVPISLEMSRRKSSFKIIALDVLAAMKNARAQKRIEESLQDPDPMVRGAAERALAETK